MTDDIKDLQKGITEILVAIGKIETEIKQLGNMAGKLEQTEKMTIEAMQSTKAAHKRLDEMTKELAEINKKVDGVKKEIEKKIEDDKKEGKGDKRWVIGTALGGSSIFLTIIFKIIDTFSKGGGGQ